MPPGRTPKNGPRRIRQCFHIIPVNVWVTGELPEQWKNAIIKALHNCQKEGPN